MLSCRKTTSVLQTVTVIVVFSVGTKRKCAYGHTNGICKVAIHCVDSQLFISDSVRICTKSDLGCQSERGLSIRFWNWIDFRFPTLVRTDTYVLLYPILHRLQRVFADVETGEWNPQSKGGFQAISLAVTLGMALIGGLITGGCTIQKCSECMLPLGQLFDLISLKLSIVIILCHTNERIWSKYTNVMKRTFVPHFGNI